MSLFWFDGKIQNTELQVLSLRNRGLTLGDGLFETMLVANGVALWADAHWQRLQNSAAVLGIGLSMTDVLLGVEALMDACGAGLKVLRVTVTRGDGARGLAAATAAPVVFISLDDFSRERIGEPVMLCTSTVRRARHAISSSHKTLSYVDAVMAAREAEAKKYGDGLMLNDVGNVACSTIGNVFFSKGKSLITPSKDQGILPGVMRSVILQMAAELGWQCEERAISAEEISQFDGAFLSNSLRLVRPVVTIESQTFSGKFDDLLTVLMQEIYHQSDFEMRSI